MKIVVEVEDVRGSFAKMIREAPKKARQFLSTAVFETGAGIQRTMEELVEVGPEGEGRTPGEHLKFDIEHRGRGMYASVGIFDDFDQVMVAVYNEYAPNRQPFMRPAAQAEAEPFGQRAIEALQKMERALTQGF